MMLQVGMENSDYLSVFCHVLLPIAYEVSQFVGGKNDICWNTI